ncbi:hypothetical protein Tco_0255826 [Tanacetum coccineum]
MVVQSQSQFGESSAIPTDPQHTPTITQPSTSQPQKTQKPRNPKRKDTQIPQSSDLSGNVADEAIHKELGDRLVRPDTTTSSLEVEQDSGGGPRGNTLRSDKDRSKLNELMELCTNLQNRVLDLEKTKTTQAKEIASLKRRLKKLEQKKRSRTHGLKRLRKIGATAKIKRLPYNVVKEVVEVINTAKLVIDAIQVSDAGDKVSAASAPTTVSAATTTTADDITLAQALADLKSKKPKMKGVVIQEPSESTKKISSQQSRLMKILFGVT